MHRNTRSAIGLFRKAATVFASTKGREAIGTICPGQPRFHQASGPGQAVSMLRGEPRQPQKGIAPGRLEPLQAF